jgi:quercetin dioxygenase-like cupin family protein
LGLDKSGVEDFVDTIITIRYRQRQGQSRMNKPILSLCLGLLLATNFQAEKVNGVQVDVLAKTSLSWDRSRLPNYSKGTPEITILRIKIPIGVQLALHKHSVINAGVLLDGELTVVTEDNNTVHLNSGDSIVEVVDTWHYGKNEGDKTAELLVFYAGVIDRPLTIYR